MDRVKKIAALHDLSCFGRGPLSIIIPVLSLLGVQVCPVPTSLLSTHTGGFTGYTSLDLCREMRRIGAHFKELGLNFDALYTGYFGSLAQMQAASDFISDFKKDALVLIDPVMGDDGCLYPGYGLDMVNFMRTMIKDADVIIPNYTECMMLLSLPSDKEKILSEADVKKLLLSLLELGPKSCVITGLNMGDSIGVVAMGGKNSDSFLIKNERVDMFFPGTGDMYASVMLGRLLLGDSLKDSLLRASAFNLKLIKETLKMNTPPRESLVFEPFLKELLEPDFGELSAIDF